MAKRSSCLAWLAAFVCLIASHAAWAQGVIRDTEIESDIRRMATPIWQQAGLRPDSIRLVIINDSTLNAFVAGGQNIFIFSGLILDTREIGELLGVIAHETGHITGGHLVRTRQNMENASIESVLGALAGVAAGLAAQDAGAGMAAITAGQQATISRMLRNSRTYESSADQAGLSFLNGAGYSAQGTANFLERLSVQEMLPEMQRSQYMLTHPLSRQRMETVRSFAAKNRYTNKPFPADYNMMHARIKAKILGFTSPQQAMREFADKTDFPSRYGYAIALYRTGKVKDALAILADLQKQNPQDGYVRELEGQILFEDGRIDDSIKYYQSAVQLIPQADLVRISLAHAYLETRDAQNAQKAIDELTRAKNTEYRNTMLFRLLAVAYGRTGQAGQAKLALAEEALLKNDKSFAIIQAKAAQKQLPSNATAARQRAADIIAFAEQNKDS